MPDSEIDGWLQLTAGTSLLGQSRLVEWNHSTYEFTAVPREVFEFCCRKEFDPVFGRLSCWIKFSAGAEMFVKGAIIINGIDIRKTGEIPYYPTENMEKWATEYRSNWKCNGTIKNTKFGTLGDLFNSNKQHRSPIEQFFDVAVNTKMDQDIIFSAFNLLMRSIRNRDIHAYIPNVRDNHNYLVPELFCRCFNIIKECVPGGGCKLNYWIQNSSGLVNELTG